ncbi:MAG TPA: response regulator [Actinomycetota bacterium]
MARKKILFIDNRPELIRQPILRLQMAGYEVHERPGGSEGLEALRSSGYNLLILDTQLPAEDGWAVLREVRQDPKLSGVRVIVFMAGKGETGQLELVEVDAELRRPFSMGALLEAVKGVIGEP